MKDKIQRRKMTCITLLSNAHLCKKENRI